jgi:ABC-type polysaccharide/polyol phosphate transport system ATPase subunit
MHPIIQVRNLGKEYRVVNANSSLREAIAGVSSWPAVAMETATHKVKCSWALRDISFEVQPGEVVGLVGATAQANPHS